MNRKPKVSKENLQTAKRLLKYVTGTYKVRFVIVFICILLSSIASISVSLSLKFLIDDFISPLIGQKDPNFAELYQGTCGAWKHFPDGSHCYIYLYTTDGSTLVRVFLKK